MTGVKTIPPSAKAVRELFTELLGRDVEVGAVEQVVDPGADPGALVGVFTDDYLKLAALVLFDVPLAAYSGAALGLVPPRTAQQSADAGALTDMLQENAAEVLNIFASVFNIGNAPHVRLQAVTAPMEPLDPDVAPWALAYVPRIDLEVTIASYGTGRVSVVVP